MGTWENGAECAVGKGRTGDIVVVLGEREDWVDVLSFPGRISSRVYNGLELIWTLLSP